MIIMTLYFNCENNLNLKEKTNNDNFDLKTISKEKISWILKINVMAKSKQKLNI